MKIQTINAFILTQAITNHRLYKDELLKHINQLPKNSLQGEGHISHTDWNKDRNSQEGYLKIFYEKILPEPMDNIEKFMRAKGWDITHVWFQQYHKNDYHSWHYHTKSQFTNVYYLELPHANYKTEVFDITTKKLIQFKVQEGDLLTLPSYLPHRSPVNSSDLIKTIISFNSNFGAKGVGTFI